MLSEIGLIGGLYTFVRLLLLVTAGGGADARPHWECVVLIAAMVVIALLTIDIFLIGTDGLIDSVANQ